MVEERGKVSGSIENEINSIITATGPAVRLGGVNRYATAKHPWWRKRSKQECP